MVKWNAQDYHRHSAAQFAWAQELIGKLDLTGTERVLDIGCGDGKVTAEIKQLVPDGGVVGVDKSEEMVRFAKDAFPIDKWPNLSFTVMDACELGFEAEFDVVFSNATLHWIIDHRPVLQGIARALVPGGCCLLQMGGRGNAQTILETITSGPCFERWGHYFADMPLPYGWYGPDDYIPWLKEAGLTPLRVELLPRDMTQPSAEGLAGWVHGLAGWVRTTWMPYTQCVPESEREHFVADIVDTYLARYPLDAQGLAHVPMVRLEVEALKEADKE